MKIEIRRRKKSYDKIIEYLVPDRVLVDKEKLPNAHQNNDTDKNDFIKKVHRWILSLSISSILRALVLSSDIQQFSY